MNRIILIGNGFDLSYGLKTSYKNFIDDLWQGIYNEFKECKGVKFNNAFVSMDNIQYEHDWIIRTCPTFNDFANTLLRQGNSDIVLSSKNIQFKNDFLREITKNTYIQSWVDIEEEYYIQLKKIVTPILSDNNKVSFLRTHNTKIKKLNEDLKQIRDALCSYLTKELQKKNITEFILEKGILDSFDFKNDFSVKKITDIEADLLKNNSIFLFLNFNYTNIVNKLVDCIRANAWQINDRIKNTRIETIYIHGELNNPKNPIIFGYGDELDEAHKEIERLGGEYLDNVKTINYSKTPNYKNLLNFINGGLYQVFIMGHSCGLSDKTLLNTLFEHENCVSIKPFYYEWKDEKGELHNDYDYIYKNIYRVFTDKASIRDKVVNKTFCKKMPQNK